VVNEGKIDGTHIKAKPWMVPTYSKEEISRLAKQNGFLKNTHEKVYRLIKIINDFQFFIELF